jgi:uncharacterized membrane protein YbaN (DUF454 family)
METRITRNPITRLVAAALGFVFLGLGIAGNFVPGLPGTMNLLISLWFFSMSSERMQRWMLTNRFFGRALRDYKSGLGIPRKVKVIAVTSILVAVVVSAGFTLNNLWIRLAVVTLGAAGVRFVLTRPTREVVVARREGFAA